MGEKSDEGEDDMYIRELKNQNASERSMADEKTTVDGTAAIIRRRQFTKTRSENFLLDASIYVVNVTTLHGPPEMYNYLDGFGGGSRAATRFPPPHLRHLSEWVCTFPKIRRRHTVLP